MPLVKTGRKRDPEGYYLALIDKEGSRLLGAYLRDLEVNIEEWGEYIALRTRSRSLLKRILRKAKSLGFIIEGDL